MVRRAVEMAVWQRQGDWSVIPHSDLVSQFRSSDYQAFLKRHTLLCSINTITLCAGNTACEEFLRMLKCERLNRNNY